MEADESVYIKALKKGYECGLTGITYWEMIDYLTPFGIPAKEYDFHVYFFKWFFDNFHQQIVTDSRIRDLKIVFHPHWMERGFNGQLDLKAVMTFEAQEKYFNYLSLINSDRKAARANRLSWAAILIAIATAIVSSIIGLLQLDYADRQEQFNQTTLSKSERSQEQLCKCSQLQYKCGSLSKPDSTTQKADTTHAAK